ncbi:MAG: peptidyl-prolyl cis-trans isomerase D [Crocinitomicaceae bacterium]|jgi:peptidyl-prolyl cis-trans isomerase D
MTKLVVCLLLLLPFTRAQAQLINTEDCWKCYQEFRNENHHQALRHCSNAIIATKGNPESAQYSLLKARIQMHLEDYNGAIATLNKVTNSASFFQSIVYGLRGDCYVESGSLYGGIENYNLAVWEDPNDLTTPIYLLKANWLTREMGVEFIGLDYIQTIITEFPEFAGKHQLDKYASSDYSSSSIPLNYKEIVQPQVLGIGTIYGETVKTEDFIEAYWLAQENSNKAAAQQRIQQTTVDETAVWRSFVNDKLMEQEFEQLGLDVSPTEFGAYILGKEGFPVLPDLESNFRDENGRFDPKLLQVRIEEMINSDDSEIRKGWQDSKEYYTLKLQREKYKVLFTVMNYHTRLDVLREVENEQSYDFSYLVKLYREFPADQFEFNDDEVKKYFEAEKESGKLTIIEDASRLLMIDIPIEPSAQDTANVFDELLKLKTEFQKTPDDSSFVMLNSDFKFYTADAFSTGVPINSQWAKSSTITYPLSLDDEFLNSRVGDLVGPYIQGTTVRMAKVIGHTSENIVARHILIALDYDNQANALKRAKELFATVTNDNFAEYALLHSDDSGSATKGGDLGLFYYAQMVQPFATYCADAPIGQIGMVKSQFGYHIVQVTERGGRIYPRLAIIEKTLKPTSKNKEDAKKQALLLIEKFASASKNLTTEEKIELFKTIADESKRVTLPCLVKNSNPVIYGLELQSAENEIIKFAFHKQTVAGTIRTTPIYDDTKWVVPMHMYHYPTEDTNDAYLPYKDAILMRLKQRKIEKTLTKEMESMTDEEFNANAQAGSSSLSNPKLGYGLESKALGNAFEAFNKDEKTTIVVGKSGIFRIQLVKKNEAPEVDSVRIKIEKERLWSGIIISSIERALNKKAQVIDNRKLFELGIQN